MAVTQPTDPSAAEMFAHATEFTNHEILTLRVWFDLDLAGNDVLAEQLLNAGLMLEHFTSLLANSPRDRTPAQIGTQSQLEFEFLRILNQANEFLRRNPKPNVPAMSRELGMK